MASDKELLHNCVLQYQELLQDIRIFGNENPDNIVGYNYLIAMASRVLERAQYLGIKNLQPLPELKK
jgi:hypothetical protein